MFPGVSVTDISTDSANKTKSAVCSQGDLLYVLIPLKVVRDGYAQVDGFADCGRLVGSHLGGILCLTAIFFWRYSGFCTLIC